LTGPTAARRRIIGTDGKPITRLLRRLEVTSYSSRRQLEKPLPGKLDIPHYPMHCQEFIVIAAFGSSSTISNVGSLIPTAAGTTVQEIFKRLTDLRELKLELLVAQSFRNNVTPVERELWIGTQEPPGSHANHPGCCREADRYAHDPAQLSHESLL